MRPGRGDMTTIVVPRSSASSIEWVMKKNLLAGLRPDPGEQLLHGLAGQAVQSAERLVHQQDFGIGGERPRDPDTLSHAT